MKYAKITYKKLFAKFTFLFCAVILTINIGASIMVASLATSNHESETDRINQTKVLQNFSSKHNVPLNDLRQLHQQLRSSNQNQQGPINYLKALVLTLGLMFTIGMHYFVPVTTGGKLFSVVIASVGIPLIFLLVHTGTLILLKGMSDILVVVATHARPIVTKYEEATAKRTVKRNLFTALALTSLSFFFLTSLVIATVEEISYLQGLWYSFMTIATIGVESLYQRKIFQSESLVKRYGLVVLSFLWLILGLTLFGATFLSLSNRNNLISLLEHRNEGKREEKVSFIEDEQRKDSAIVKNEKIDNENGLPKTHDSQYQTFDLL